MIVVVPFLIFFGLAVSSDVQGDKVHVPQHGGEGVFVLPAHRD